MRTRAVGYVLPVGEPKTWVGEWVRSKEFWRDVVTRSISGLVVVGVGALVAGVASFFALPGAAPLLLIIGSSVVALLLGVLASTWWYRICTGRAERALAERVEADGPGSRIARSVAALLATIVATVAGVVLVWAAIGWAYLSLLEAVPAWFPEVFAA